MSDSDYVSFGDVARKQLGMQCQYACHYLQQKSLSYDIRWTGNVHNYHGIKIHKNDVVTFVERVNDWRRQQGIIA